MQRDGTDLLYSARDLLTFLGCVHSTALDRLHLAGGVTLDEQPEDQYLALLKQKGNEHEREYLETLRQKGCTIREIERVESLSVMAEATRQAMRDGVDVIYQGALVRSPWFGYSDFLMKVDAPSRLGPYSYDVADTKLARTARPKHVVQLCLYAELLGAEQGVLPENAQVVLGDGTTFPFRLRDYLYYCQSAQERFLEFIAAEAVQTAAEPCEHCQMCRWSERCEREWVEIDHLSLVARINRTQRKRLVANGITTLAALATLPADSAVPRVQRDTLDRIRSQAALQLSRRTTGENAVEVLPPAPRRGFARLPMPDEGDVFFDMEGDPIYAKDGSLEYLFGFHYLDDGQERFTPFWAHDRASERKAFEDAMDFMTDRLRRYPRAYIYHYASYEETALKKLAQKYGAAPPVPTKDETQPAALKRLAQEYGTRENEVDDLLRNRKLVDLYKVVREGIRISEPSYSLKNLEVFFAPERTQDIKAGGDSIVAFEHWLVVRDDKLLQQIEEYNAFDCRSTRLCRDWLLTLKPQDVAWFDPVAEKAADDDKERVQEAKRRENDQRILALRTALLEGVPDDERSWRELLGYLLEYHRREARREWWEFFDRLYEKSREQLIEDSEAIAGLTRDETVPGRREARSMVWTLKFPEQETKLCAGDKVVRVDTEETLQIVALDEGEGHLELKLGPTRKPLDDDISIVAPGPFDDRVQREALIRYADAVIAGGESRYSAVTSILRKDRPTVRDGVLADVSHDLLQHTISVVGQMADTHLIIQGPPGSGKTFTSAHAIVELLRNGRRVGVTSLSHKAINNLLKKVEEVARERNVSFRGVKKSGDEDELFNGSMIEDTDKNEVAADDAYQLVAGTAWLLSRPEFDQKVDYLFVDEAGQLSLATVVATGLSARNIVLVGDQMQLSQPVKGSHPGGSGVSVLDHLVGDWPTVPADRGIFLGRTWRMHPRLCQFVSDAFYDGRLESVDGTARQKLEIPDNGLAPFGLRFVGISHEDNGQRSSEEAEQLNAAYRHLLNQTWVDFEGRTRPIGVDDILVVSPYNLQVNLLKEVLPDDARVGTVDKFQGQEAAVVLISMAASSGEHVPRGIDFLFSPNRLNVAISRARCLAVVFASERLLATASHSVSQLRRVNTMCWAKAFSRGSG